MDWTLFFAALAAVVSVLNFLFLVFLDSLYPVLKEDDEAGTDEIDTQQSTNDNFIASSHRKPPTRRSRRFTDKSKDWLDAHSAESRR